MKIGIFWYFNNDVIGIAHNFNFADIDSLGLIDSPYTHVEYWEVLRQKNSALLDIEYEEIPRGRVIYSKNGDRFIVYLDSKLMSQEIINLILDFFDLNDANVIFKKDSHYLT